MIKMQGCPVRWKRRWAASAFLLLFWLYLLLAGDTFRGDDFMSSIVDTEEKAVWEGSNAGYLTYGPYLSYVKGRYVMYLDGETDTQNNIIDIYSGSAGKQYYADVVQFEDRIVFELDEEISDLEIRIYYAGVGMLKVDRVVIRRQYGFFTYAAILLLNLLLFAALCVDLEHGDNSHGTTEAVLRFGVRLIRLALASFLVVTLTEYLRAERMLPFLDLLQSNWRIMALNFLVVFLIMTVIYLLCRNMGASILAVGALFYALALIDYNYYNLRGEAFKLSELALAGEAADVIEGYTVTVPVIFSAVLFFLALGAFTLGFHREKLNRDIRLLGIAASVLLFGTIYVNVESVIEDCGSVPNVFVTKEFYDVNGYTLGLVRTASNGMTKPANYSRDYILALKAEVAGDEAAESGTYPNIIFIQNESLYDLELISDRMWSEDPLLSIRELQQAYTSGMLISPTAGGGTCNVEYEALTGYPYYNTEGTPFTNMLKKETTSLVSILKDQGYQTEAIHLNRRDFFNRDTAYANLGFDQTVFLEDVSGGSEEDLFNGWYGDRFVYDELIREFESREKDVPYFAHVVTTQNHGAYSYAYDDHGILVESDLDEEDRRQLQTFLNLEKESAESLKDLLAYFEAVPEPTIVVFWGDHCPGYFLFGMSVGDSVGEYIDMHLTPLLIWDNYGLEREELGVVSAYQISPYILNLVGIHTDAYMDYMYRNAVPNVLNEIEILGRNEYRYKTDWDEEKKAVYDNVWLLQYDRMFGKKYSLTEE